MGLSSPFSTTSLVFGLLPFVVYKEIKAGTAFSKKPATIVNELRDLYVKRFQSRQRHALDRSVPKIFAH